MDNEQGKGNKPYKSHIVLGMPGPNIRFETARACFCNCAKGQKLAVVGADNASWDNMNALWAFALNLALTDDVTHFAMIHADIEPSLEQDWISILIEEMEKFGADFISAVVPIKDGRGITSSGIGDPNDRWAPWRRFTMREIHSFPETFTAADIGYGDKFLNHNSGMIVADIRKPVFRRTKPDGELAIWFDFRKRIQVDPDTGKVTLVGESEDWGFSRRLWEQGARSVITRKIVLKHYGATGYPTGYPWGDPHDEASRVKWGADAAAVKSVAPQGRNTIRGWLTVKEQAELQRLAEDKTVLEIGSYCGKSTVAMAQTAKHVIAIDPFIGVPAGSRRDSAGMTSDNDTPGGLREEFFANLDAYGVREKVTPIVAMFEDAVGTVDLRKVQVAFIDGSHDYASTLKAGLMLRPVLDRGGVIAFHDYSDGDPEAKRAIKDFAAIVERPFYTVDSLAVFGGAA